MPRVADESELGPHFPWDEWQKQLANSPTGALIFGPDDFGTLSVEAFAKRAKKALRGARISLRRGEVLVALDA